MIKVAIILTCHNRICKTERCLDTIIQGNKEYDITFFITEDASIDGTLEMLINKTKLNYENVRFIITKGNGNLFWNRGMFISFEKALKENFQFYIWVNDDVKFYDSFISDLIADYNYAKQINKYSIITGATKWSNKKQVSYGGGKLLNKKNILNFRILAPNGNIQECDVMNGNCVLISKDLSEKVGNLDYRYEHAFGDIDYGFRVKRIGGVIFVSSKFIGDCDKNCHINTWGDYRLPILKRIKLMKNKNGLPRRSLKLILKKWTGFRWIIYYYRPYFHIFVSNILFKLRVKDYKP